jgi:hypothetical protein
MREPKPTTKSWILVGALLAAVAPSEAGAEGRPTWAQPPPPRYVVDPAPVPVAERDPYDTAGLVIAGGGLGGLILRADGETSVTPSYLLHLGLAVGAAEFALRANLAPNAITWTDPEGRGVDVGIYATRASFNYRFLQGSVIHPVAGLGLEMIAATPTMGADGYCFAASARLGLELAFPLSNGALALGIDTTGHLPFAATDTFHADLSLMLGFGAYLDYRF